MVGRLDKEPMLATRIIAKYEDNTRRWYTVLIITKIDGSKCPMDTRHVQSLDDPGTARCL